MFCLTFAALGQTDSTVIVHPDHTVSFRYYAPDAGKVKLDGTFQKKPQKMLREGDYWIFHLDTLPPEMYSYRFLINKKHAVPEAAAPGVVRDIEKYYRYFIIEGDTTQYLFDRSVPHGRVEYVWYPSTMNGMSQRRMCVYLPSEYAAHPEKQYPVLYLLHGSGGDETAWTDYGRAQQILDNMIADSVIQPLIVVMPNGNINLDAAQGESPWMDKKPSANNVSSMAGKYEKSFRKEIVGYVDKHYRTLPDKEHRAIAGLSLGGLHTVYISLNNPDLFNYVGLFSAQTSNMLDDRKLLMINRAQRNTKRIKQAWGTIFNFTPSESIFDEKLNEVDVYSNLDDKLRKQFENAPALYYIAIGSDDMLLKFNNHFRARLDSLGCPYYYHETPGNHCWENWRHYLIEFLPMVKW